MTRLSSLQITSVLSAARVDGIHAGGVTFLRHTLAGAGAGMTPADSRDVELLEELGKARPPAPIRGYANPLARPVQPGYGREGAPLGSADLAWLDRLPREPAQVSDQDARELAGLALQVPAGSPDARLVRSMLEPVRQLHARREAEAEIAAARAAQPVQIPAVAVQVLRDAIAREQPALTLPEAEARAHQTLQELTANAERARADALAQAQAKLAALDAPADDLTSAPLEPSPAAA